MFLSRNKKNIATVWLKDVPYQLKSYIFLWRNKKNILSVTQNKKKKKISVAPDLNVMQMKIILLLHKNKLWVCMSSISTRCS